MILPAQAGIGVTEYRQALNVTYPEQEFIFTSPPLQTCRAITLSILKSYAAARAVRDRVGSVIYSDGVDSARSTGRMRRAVCTVDFDFQHFADGDSDKQYWNMSAARLICALLIHGRDNMKRLSLSLGLLLCAALTGCTGTQSIRAQSPSDAYSVVPTGCSDNCQGGPDCRLNCRPGAGYGAGGNSAYCPQYGGGYGGGMTFDQIQAHHAGWQNQRYGGGGIQHPNHRHWYSFDEPKDLVYPQANTPTAMVQYPYYTLKGPECFYMK